jgi:tRNA (adenine37-N6)-methyltransferase
MAKTMAEFTLTPIGYFKGTRKTKSSIPRQGHLSQQIGFIEFKKGFDSKSALKGIEKMTHVWIIFQFHEATAQPKPLVRPPRAPEIQVGVWVTRSPYRPNSLGLTLAKVEEVRDGKLYLSQVDLLDETPVFDIKPYVTDSDLPKKPKLGWIDEIEVWKFKFSAQALNELNWLYNNGFAEIHDVIESQFGTPPLQPKRKRVKELGKDFILSYRTWRFIFSLNKKTRTSLIKKIQSGYSGVELQDSKDPYLDKKLHRDFLDFINAEKNKY